MTRQLQREGVRANHERVARIMRERGLKANPQKRFAVTSDGAAVAPFPKPGTGLFCCADPTSSGWPILTYIRTLTGFVHLAAIFDAWSRRAIGYTIARHMDAPYVKEV